MSSILVSTRGMFVFDYIHLILWFSIGNFCNFSNINFFRSVGTFARALDCSSSVKQPSLHMSAAAASRDITLVCILTKLAKVLNLIILFYTIYIRILWIGVIGKTFDQICEFPKYRQIWDLCGLSIKRYLISEICEWPYFVGVNSSCWYFYV